MEEAPAKPNLPKIKILGSAKLLGPEGLTMCARHHEKSQESCRGGEVKEGRAAENQGSEWTLLIYASRALSPYVTSGDSKGMLLTAPETQEKNQG